MMWISHLAFAIKSHPNTRRKRVAPKRKELCCSKPQSALMASRKEIKIIRGIGFGCDEAAIKALETSRFAPAKQAEKPVVVRIQIPYRFKLED